MERPLERSVRSSKASARAERLYMCAIRSTDEFCVETVQFRWCSRSRLRPLHATYNMVDTVRFCASRSLGLGSFSLCVTASVHGEQHENGRHISWKFGPATLQERAFASIRTPSTHGPKVSKEFTNHPDKGSKGSLYI